ncbi:MAG: hypothetical protein AAGJ46_08080 [Planctomycetota bacterium]
MNASTHLWFRAAAVVLVAAIGIAATPSRAAAESSSDEPPLDKGFFLGDYIVKDIRPVEGSKTTLKFSIHAYVIGNDVERFEKLLKSRTQRVRNQVIIAARLADPADFRDPKLSRFRRRMLLRFRRALPELKIASVYFSDFHYSVD